MNKSSVSRKSSDITADLGDTTTNYEKGNTNASELVSQDIKGEEQNDEEGASFSAPESSVVLCTDPGREGYSVASTNGER